MTARLFFIAEAGVNHNGDVDRAREMIDVAKKAGADAVKFQAFDPAGLVAAGAATAAYQAANTGVSNQQELLRKFALSRTDFADLAAHCSSIGIEFLCTAFDVDFIEALVQIGMRRIKVASGELTNAPALRRFASLGLPVIISTGMATMAEVEEAVTVLRASGCSDITILHCTSLYPAPDEAINLNAMKSMQAALNLPVGYSDHSLGGHIAVAAVALGATVIEKHFTLDRSLPGPDHKASLEPHELRDLVAKLRSTAVALGDGVKQPAADEKATAALVRRSWHAARALPAGTILSVTDLTLKRPATGLAPGQNLVGRKLKSDRKADDPIRAGDLS